MSLQGSKRLVRQRQLPSIDLRCPLSGSESEGSPVALRPSPDIRCLGQTTLKLPLGPSAIPVRVRSSEGLGAVAERGVGAPGRTTHQPKRGRSLYEPNLFVALEALDAAKAEDSA